MEMTPVPLMGLPQVPPLEAEARTELLATLNGCVIGREILQAGIVDAAPAALAWFVCRNGAAFAVDRLDGAPLHLSAANTVRGVEVLETAEPMLCALEAALGIELEPEALEQGAPPGAERILRLMPGKEMSFYLALPPGLRLAPRPAPFSPGLLHHVPLPVTMRITGPRLSPVEAADIEPGDLVLLGPGPLRAMLDVPGRSRLEGRYDPAAASFHPHRPAADAPAPVQPAPPQDTAENPTAQVPTALQEHPL